MHADRTGPYGIKNAEGTIAAEAVDRRPTVDDTGSRSTPVPVQRHRYVDANHQRSAASVRVPQSGTSPMPPSWNQIASWLKQIGNLRQAA